MAYIGTEPKDVRSFGRAKFDYTATQGQTAFTGADDDGKTLGFTDGQIEVFVNGILMDESDFSTSNGNTVTLASAANLNDIISIVALQTDIPNSDYVPASGGTFSGNVTHSGTVTHNGAVTNSSTTTMTGDLTVTGADVTITGSTNTDATLNVLSPNWVTGAYADINISYQPTGRKIRGHYDNGIEIFTNNANSALKVDPNGRVTMPYQPAFRAYSTVASWTLLPSNTWVIAALEAEEYDQGSNYNTSNYRFTAPIAGLYQFTLFAYARIQSGGQTASTNYWTARFGINGQTQGVHCIVGYVSDGEQDNTCTTTSTFDLSANDYVEVYLRGHSYSAEYYRTLCSFEGRLVG